MFKRIYTKIICNVQKPFTQSKLNIWNIRNSKHSTIHNTSILFIINSKVGMINKNITIVNKYFMLGLLPKMLTFVFFFFFLITTILILIY